MNERNILIESLKQIMNDSQNVVRILISSNHKSSFYGEFPQCKELEIEQNFINPGISEFIKEEGRRYIRSRSGLWRNPVPIEDEVEKVVTRTTNDGWSMFVQKSVSMGTCD